MERCPGKAAADTRRRGVANRSWPSQAAVPRATTEGHLPKPHDVDALEAAILGAAIPGSWSAHLSGWLGEVPQWALAVATGLPLTAWAARAYLVRKGVALDGEFRPDAWGKQGDARRSVAWRSPSAP